MFIQRNSLYARTGLIALTALFLIFLKLADTNAQVSKVGATVEGNVRDSSGAAISNAKVTLRNTETNQMRAVATDDRGAFHAGELSAGNYEVRVEYPAFALYRLASVGLPLGGTVHLNILLVLASSSSEVTVNAQPSSIDPSQTSVVSSVDKERIEELPVRSRNYLDFVLLAPGVSGSPPTSGASGTTPLAGSGFTFGGLRTRSNNISIDGLDNNDEYTGSSRIELSPEIVQEFQVVNNGLSAESGGASGGSINVITRSGTNTTHGDAFIFVQDGALNARDPFETTPGRPAFRRYRTGFALGGPVVKNRTFYYAAIEQEHHRGQSSTDISPDLASTINAFLATGAYPRLSTRQIATDFFPIAREETETAGRLDHQLKGDTSLMLRYAFTNNKESSDAFNTTGIVDASGRGSQFTSDQSVSGSLTSVFGSEAVGDLRFQVSTRHAVLRTNDSLGPEIVIAGLADFGRPYGGPSTRRENHYQAGYTYARAYGKHVFKAGGTVSRVNLEASVEDGFGGIYLFGDLSDFLNGQPDQFRQAFGSTNVNLPVTTFGAFVQDHWSLTSHVMLDLGVRFDFEHLPAGFNQDTGNVSPRIGVAWSPSSKWVVRAGWGIFFDRYVLANLARGLEKNGTQAFEQVADGPLAASLFAAAEGGPLSVPASGIAPSIFRPDPNLVTPYSQQASAGVEYQLARNVTLRADYLMVRGVHLSRTRNINLLAPVLLTIANAERLGIPDPTPQQVGRDVFVPGRVDARFDDIYQIEDSASSTYHGVSFSLNRRMSDEFEFSAAYTVSKTIDDASDFEEQPENPFNLHAERALSNQDQRQRFVFNALWDLPIGENEGEGKTQAANHGWASRMFSHIELAAIVTLGTGRPVDPLTGLDSNRSHAFPLSVRPLDQGRNSLRTSGLTSTDFRVLKYFPFGKSARLDLVAEAFNLFNHPNILTINPVFGSNLAPLAGLGQPIEGAGARRVQFSLDFEF
ncbi:MAG: TonB-dependent receptor [Acidobacteriia bacterium]|nr:TonB-dependent receptor [Terriglobia bacterium]